MGADLNLHPRGMNSAVLRSRGKGEVHLHVLTQKDIGTSAVLNEKKDVME